MSLPPLEGRADSRRQARARWGGNATSGDWRRVSAPPGRALTRPSPPSPRGEGDAACARSLRGFHRVLDVRDRGELDIVELAADLLDLADVDVLDDVAGLRVDRDRSARARPGHALHGRDERVAGGVAVRLLQGLVDEVHAVVAAEAHEV